MSSSAPCPKSSSVDSLVAGELSDDERNEVYAHLKLCADCLQYLRDLRAAADSGVDRNAATNTMSGKDAEQRDLIQSPAPDFDAFPTGFKISQETRKNIGQPASLLNQHDHFGPYKIMAVLGRGGMGIVFKAEDTVLKREVAVKVLGALLAGDLAGKQRFIREGRAAAAVKHENIVAIYNVGGIDTDPFLVMEYIEGESLHDHLTVRGALPAQEVIRIGAQIADGLAAAHARGLVHRDIKPANILLEKDTERVKITDFGLARAVDDGSLTRTGEICGTPNYMAPEQAHGETVDHRADLFSLGSVLYCLCTGKLPFHASSSMAILRKVCEETPTRVDVHNADIPAWLAQLISRLHAKNPDDRIQSAAEVAEALRSGELPVIPENVVRDRQRDDAPHSEARQFKLKYGLFMAAMSVLICVSSLPAFYFLAPLGRGAQAPRDVAASGPAYQSVGQPNDAMTPAKQQNENKSANPLPSSKTARKKKAANGKAPSQPTNNGPASPAKRPAYVVVKSNHYHSSGFLSDVGIQIRCRISGKLYRLREGRYQLQPGSYEISSSRLPPGLSISPRVFTIGAGDSETILVEHTEPRDFNRKGTPPGFGNHPPPPPGFPPPKGRPPFPRPRF